MFHLQDGSGTREIHQGKTDQKLAILSFFSRKNADFCGRNFERRGAEGGFKFEKNVPDLMNHGWECLADSGTHGSADRSWERDNFLASRQ